MSRVEKKLGETATMAETNTRGLGGGTVEDSSNDSETGNLGEEIHGKLQLR